MPQSKFFYFIAVIEGTTIAAIELLGQRIIASYYGDTLKVWSCVLAITLLSLAAGYFFGGKISQNQNEKLKKKISQNLLISSVFFSFIPLSIYVFYPVYSHLSFTTGCILLCLLIYSPTLVFLSSVIPCTIKFFTPLVNSSGKMTGKIYSISSFSSIVVFLLLGFYLIPAIGITIPFVFFVLLQVIGWIYFIRVEKHYTLLLLIFIFSLSAILIKVKKTKSSFTVQFGSESILGQLKVIDYKFNKIPARYLLINNIPQTNITIEHPDNSLFMYVHAISTIASVKKPLSDVLMCGLGGGSLCQEFSKLRFNIDVVEIDKRMIDISKKFFSLNFKGNIFIDDCRHYLRTCSKKYDIIIIDVLNGEAPPSYMFTIETLRSLKKNLKDDGMIIFEIPSYAYGSKGIVTGSVYKTLVHAGFSTKIIFLEKEQQNILHDIIVWAGNKELANLEIDENRLNLCCKSQSFLKNMTTAEMDKVDTANAMIFTDDKNAMEPLHSKVILEYRKKMIQNIAGMQFEEGTQFFK